MSVCCVVCTHARPKYNIWISMKNILERIYTKSLRNCTSHKSYVWWVYIFVPLLLLQLLLHTTPVLQIFNFFLFLIATRKNSRNLWIYSFYWILFTYLLLFGLLFLLSLLRYYSCDSLLYVCMLKLKRVSLFSNILCIRVHILKYFIFLLDIFFKRLFLCLLIEYLFFYSWFAFSRYFSLLSLSVLMYFSLVFAFYFPFLNVIWSINKYSTKQKRNEQIIEDSIELKWNGAHII